MPIPPFDPDYPRDLAGYGEDPPHARWPGGARIAVQFVLNYEEGGENAVLHGDEASETFLSDIVGAQAFRMRHLSMESLYEYGSRAGVWRLLRLFRDRGVPLTVFGVGNSTPKGRFVRLRDEAQYDRMGKLMPEVVLVATRER